VSFVDIFVQKGLQIKDHADILAQHHDAFFD